VIVDLEVLVEDCRKIEAYGCMLFLLLYASVTGLYQTMVLTCDHSHFLQDIK